MYGYIALLRKDLTQFGEEDVIRPVPGSGYTLCLMEVKKVNIIHIMRQLKQLTIIYSTRLIIKSIGGNTNATKKVAPKSATLN